MYPAQELSRLAAVKTALRRDITHRRVQCTLAAAQAVRPLAWLDRMLDFCRRLSPFALVAAIPLGFLMKRAPAPRPRLLGLLLRWGPLVFAGMRGISSAVKTHRAKTAAARE